MGEIKFRIANKEVTGEVIIIDDSSIKDRKGKDKVQTQRDIILNCCCELLDRNDLVISRDKNGAPFFEDAALPFISISHSNNWFALQLSEKDRVGVDIQVLKSDIEKGMRYFVNEKEEKALEINSLNLNIIWAAKEAVYKYKKGNLEFYKEAMTVLSIDSDSLLVEVGDEHVKCVYLLQEDFVLVYID
jgi:phosphopantetheinyl transferase